MKLLLSALTLFFLSANYPAEVVKKESDLLVYAQQKMNIEKDSILIFLLF